MRKQLTQPILISLVISLCVVSHTAPAAATAVTNQVAVLGWSGSIDTNLRMSKLGKRDFTLAVRFMSQYPYAYAGPILTDSVASFDVGQADYRWGEDHPFAFNPPRFGTFGHPHLYLRAGSNYAIYNVGQLEQATGAPEDVASFADFESGTYEGWEVEGPAFGVEPATGPITWQNPIVGAWGRYLVNTFNPDDSTTGRARSEPFTVSRRFIHFLIGGGDYEAGTCLNLLVDGRVVRTATGRNNEALLPERWDVGELLGMQAQLEIVDGEVGPWGHVLVDRIAFTDRPDTGLIYPGVMYGGRWQHLAVVGTRNGNRTHTLALYLNGVHLRPLGGQADLVVWSADLVVRHATLRMGRHTTALVGGYDPQFFGLLDDVAVFRRALTDSEVADLAEATRLAGTEPGLWAAYVFEEAEAGGAPAQSTVLRPVTMNGRAYVAPATTNRDDLADRLSLAVPRTEVDMVLPFPPGQAWIVGQGGDAPHGTHSGFAAFCWDLEIADRPYPATRGQLVTATGPGRVVFVEERHPDETPGSGGNVVIVRQAPFEFTSNLHVRQGSFRRVTGYTRSVPPQELADELRPVVATGDPLTEVGDTGAGPGNYHLHFAVTNGPDGQGPAVTVPASFVNYEVSDDRGRTWTFVSRGVPQGGQWVRRP